MRVLGLPPGSWREWLKPFSVSLMVFFGVGPVFGILAYSISLIIADVDFEFSRLGIIPYFLVIGWPLAIIMTWKWLIFMSIISIVLIYFVKQRLIRQIFIFCYGVSALNLFIPLRKVSAVDALLPWVFSCGTTASLCLIIVEALLRRQLRSSQDRRSGFAIGGLS